MIDDPLDHVLEAMRDVLCRAERDVIVPKAASLSMSRPCIRAGDHFIPGETSLTFTMTWSNKDQAEKEENE